ncbi:hypothetical protein U1Q18_014572 [Sarracenia purpurea var. burkii]
MQASGEPVVLAGFARGFVEVQMLLEVFLCLDGDDDVFFTRLRASDGGFNLVLSDQFLGKVTFSLPPKCSLSGIHMLAGLVPGRASRYGRGHCNLVGWWDYIRNEFYGGPTDYYYHLFEVYSVPSVLELWDPAGYFRTWLWIGNVRVYVQYCGIEWLRTGIYLRWDFVY